MNKKTLRRVLCFLLAFVVFISMPLDLHAEAVAIELGWMTWVLISAMTAMGFSFAVSGGIDALQSAVEDAVDEYDEYREVIGFNNGLFELLDDKLLFGGGGGQGPNLGNRFWLTAAGVAAVAEFVQWVRENKWFAGEEQVDSLSYDYVDAFNPSYFQFINTETTSSDYPYWHANLGTGVYPHQLFNYGTEEEPTFWFLNSNNDKLWFASSVTSSGVRKIITYVNGSSVHVKDMPSDIDFDANNTLLYITFISKYIYIRPATDYEDYELAWGTGQMSSSYFADFLKSASLSSTITSPTEVIDFDVQEGQALELDFSIFENQEFNSPEEMADAIKNKIVETGTVPNVKPEVVVEPSTLPQPTPVPSPPVYEDVDGLGLPSLAETMQNKFPFCLPYDLSRVFQIFYAEPVAPYWEVDLFSTLGNRVPFADNTAFTIDLAQYDELGAISRWMTTIGYVLLLILITRQTTKW